MVASFSKQPIHPFWCYPAPPGLARSCVAGSLPWVSPLVEFDGHERVGDGCVVFPGPCIDETSRRIDDPIDTGRPMPGAVRRQHDDTVATAHAKINLCRGHDQRPRCARLRELV